MEKIKSKIKRNNNIKIENRENKGKKQVEPNEEVILKGELGIALSFFLTRGKYQLMKIFKKKELISKNYLKNQNYQQLKILVNLLIN